MIFIVWAQEHDRSGDPEFLVAYNTREAADSTKAIIEKAGSYRAIKVSTVPMEGEYDLQTKDTSKESQTMA